MKILYTLIICLSLTSCFIEPKKENKPEQIENISTTTDNDTNTFDINYPVKEVETEKTESIIKPVFTFKDLADLYSDSPDNFSNSVYEKGFIYEKFEDYGSFNVYFYTNKNITVTYSIEKHTLKLLGVSYNTDIYEEYEYFISECEKLGFKKEVKELKSKTGKYIEFSGVDFNVWFNESIDNSNLKYGIYLKNK